MPRTAILFDFDGTLADTLPLCLVALRSALLRNTGRVYADREITAHWGFCEEGILQRTAPAVWERCVMSYLEEYERSHHLCPAPFPGILELLGSLRRRGVLLGLVTGKGPRSVQISLRRLGMAELFDEVRTGSPDGDVKAGQIAEMIQAFQVPPERAAYVGDFASDLRAARTAGVRALAAAWAPGVSSAALEAEGPDELFRSIAELDRWVEGWLAGEASGASGPISSSCR